jgi:cellulose biosynthesis protein BcsR
MPDHTKNDVALLQEYLGDTSRLAYVDFQEAEAVRSALQRWPLLRRLMQQADTSAQSRSPAWPPKEPMRPRGDGQG